MNATDVIGVVAAVGLAGAAWGAERADESARLDVGSGVDFAAAAAAQPEEEGETDFSQQGLWDGWSGDVFLGLTGSDGNTQRTSLRVGGSADKETTNWLFTNSLEYANSQDDGEESEDRLRVNLRQERKFKDSPWSAFVQEIYDYDEFDSFLHRFNGLVGAGYKHIDTDKIQLRYNAGGGFRWESGNDADPGFVPEVFVGFEYENQLTEKQSVQLDSTVFLQLDEFEARWVTNALWEVLLDEETDLNLRVGVRNEYDSSAAGDTANNDVDFFVLLALKY